MKLITFDRTKNINYFGKCKLQFQGIEKCLNIKMLDKDPEEIMTATFNRLFICKNNFLCCMNQNSMNPLILVFSAKEKCELIFDAILKSKSRQPQSRNSVFNEKQLFKDVFYLPLIKAIKTGANGFQDLKKIVLDFVNSLGNDEKIYYFNTFAELSLTSELKENVEDEKHVENSIHFPSASETVFSIPLKCERPKRSLNKNISYQECDENDESQRKRKKITVSVKTSHNKSTISHFDVPTPKNSPENVDFDIVEYLHDGKFDKKLLIFTSNERKQCYEFINIWGSYIFNCIKCLAQKKHTIIKATVNNDGSKIFDFNTEKHICEPIEYFPGNYQSSLIIKSSNFKLIKRLFKGKMRPLLTIFDINDKNMCYRFGFDSNRNHYFCIKCKQQSRMITVRFIQYEEKTAVELNRLEHVCKPKKYIP